MSLVNTHRHQFEWLVNEESEARGLPLIMTAGSGNKNGDADFRMTHNTDWPFRVGLELKSSVLKRSHTVPPKEWEKADMQISRSGAIPIFCTQMEDGTWMAHLKGTDLLDILAVALGVENED